MVRAFVFLLSVLVTLAAMVVDGVIGDGTFVEGDAVSLVLNVFLASQVQYQKHLKDLALDSIPISTEPMTTNMLDTFADSDRT